MGSILSAGVGGRSIPRGAVWCREEESTAQCADRARSAGDRFAYADLPDWYKPVYRTGMAALAFNPLTFPLVSAGCDSGSGKGNADEADTISGAPQADTADSPQEIEKEKLKSPCDTDGNGLIDDDQIPDPALREFIKSYLGLEPTDVITLELAEGMSGSAFESGFFCNFLSQDYNFLPEDDTFAISNLGGLQCFPNLVCFNLRFVNSNHEQPLDLEPLKGLIRLQLLGLQSSQITDIGPLKGLVDLRYLYLAHNEITDLSPLQGLTKLETLALSSNLIEDISPLQGLVNVITLSLDSNQISDIVPLGGLIALIDLDLSGNQIINLSGLETLVNLKYLDLAYNQITDISQLQGLVELTDIDLYDNQISDIYPLISNPGLGVGDKVVLNYNSLYSEQFYALCDKGVTVYWDNKACNN